MNEIASKISSYHIFNYLLPGCLFAVAADNLLHLHLSQASIVLGVFTYYFYGLVISRLGSLVVGPFLRRIGFIKLADYGDFIAASKVDTKIEILSEVNNTYRTLVSLCLAITLLGALLKVTAHFPVTLFPLKVVGALGLLVLMSFSYRKQTAFVTKRVEACASTPRIIT